jgi:hypothetical protein
MQGWQIFFSYFEKPELSLINGPPSRGSASKYGM